MTKRMVTIFIVSSALSTAAIAVTIHTPQTYYVTTEGNDSNSGLSTSAPWKTLTNLKSKVFGPGDAVLLRGGESFTGCLHFSPSHIQSTQAQPFSLGSYGTGNFILISNCSGAYSAAVQIESINGFVLKHATIVGNPIAPTSYGVWIYNTTTAITGGITIENSDISGFYATGTSYGGEVFISTSSASVGSMTNILIQNNQLHGATPASPDDNGITGFSHGNITNVTYQGNTVYNIGSHSGGSPGTLGSGILANGLNGAVVQNNIVHDVGGNTTSCGGPSGIWTFGSNNVKIQYNEVYNVRPILKTAGCDWDGYDMDMNVTNSFVQYNYSHNNYGAGFLLYGTGGKTWGTNILRYNISENDGTGITMNLDNNMQPMVYNNTVFSGGGSSLVTSPAAFSIAWHAPNSGVVANNIFYTTGTSADLIRVYAPYNNPTVSGMLMLNNDYFAVNKTAIAWNTAAASNYSTVAAWSSTTGFDKYAKSVDPLFENAGATGACTSLSYSCNAGYNLLPSSPLIGAGANLTAPFATQAYYGNIGPQDYFGNLTSAAGHVYDLGAADANNFKLITNGDFQLGLNNWTVASGLVTLVTPLENGQTKKLASIAGGTGVLQQKLSTPLIPNTPYELLAAGMAGEGVNAWVRITFLNSSGVVVNSFYGRVPNSDTLSTIAINVFVPATAASAVVSFEKDTETSTAEVGDFMLMQKIL